MKPILLWLDDLRNPVIWAKDYSGYKIIWVKSYNDFIKYISEHGIPDIISFDHDLDEEHYQMIFNLLKPNFKIPYNKFKEKSGYDCALWLIEYCVKNKLNLPDIKIHSMNPIGRENIKNLFIKYVQKK